MSAQCVHCGRDMADTAYACAGCAQSLAETLVTAAGHAEDAEAVLARQTRYGAGSRASSAEPLPVDLTAAAKLRPIQTAICGWSRIVTDETGRRPRWRPQAGPLCPPTGTPCPHDSCGAIRRRLPPPPIALAAAWLAQQTGWLRRHPAAAEAFNDLHAACEQLARLVDRPPDKDLVGMCDCGRVLYATRGKIYVRCPPPCGATWNVAASRDILRKALDGRLVTAAEAARLAAYLDTDRTQAQIRKLVNAWAARGELMTHGEVRVDHECGAKCEAGCAVEVDITHTYRFGDVADRLARAPRRNREGAAA